MKKLLIIPALIGTTLFAGINGTSSCSNAVAVELNQDITLSPNNDKTYNGNPQKYGYYSFTVAQDTEAVISFDTPDDSGSYMALYSNCSSSIASKWSASNTTGMIEKTLLAGTYQFYISKDGSTVKDIKVNIVASTDTVTPPPENGGGDTNHKALTRAELDELMHAWAKKPSEENANKIINANTSEITDMSGIFALSLSENLYISEFNLDIGKWDVSKVTNMNGMFSYSIFNQDISHWDVSNVTNMSNMFSYNSEFNQDISHWDISNVVSNQDFSLPSGLIDAHNPFKQTNNNNTTNVGIIGGANPSLATTIEVNKKLLLLPSYESEYRGTPQKYAYYRFTVPSDTQATITYKAPSEGGSYLKLQNSDNSKIITNWTAKNTSTKVHTTLTEGDYYFLINKNGVANQNIQFTISGIHDDFSLEELTEDITLRIELMLMIADGEDVTKLNTSKITDMSGLFDINAVDNINLTKTQKDNIINFNQNISNWDVSNVRDMSNMFKSSRFNQDIGKWDVSKVTNMNGMFSYSIFNQDISHWDVSNVTNMSNMFSYNSEFNQDISHWDISNVVSNQDFSLPSGLIDAHNPFKQTNNNNTTNVGIIGGANPSLATTIEVNKKLLLLPSYESEYRGTPQKYAYYRFTVPSDTQATITYKAPSEGGSYLKLQNSDNSKIITNWTAKNTSTKVHTTLTEGDYYFLINKNGVANQDIQLKIKF